MELTSKQRTHLRQLAHHLDAVVLVGGGGISDAIVAKVDAELENHELIKVKIGKESPIEKSEAGRILVERTGASLAQIIGRTLVLYRRRKKNPEIRLPRATAAPVPNQPPAPPADVAEDAGYDDEGGDEGGDE